LEDGQYYEKLKLIELSNYGYLRLFYIDLLIIIKNKSFGYLITLFLLQFLHVLGQIFLI